MENKIKEEELFIPKTKHKALKIILAIILIGAMIAGGYYLYKEKFSNPNKTVISIIEDIEKSVKNNTNNSEIYKLNGILKINANLSDKYKPITDIINNLDIQFVTEADIKNKIVNSTLNTKYKGEQLVDVDVYTEDNTSYILPHDIYDKYLKYSLNGVTEEIGLDALKVDLNKNDIKTLINSIMKATKNSLEKLEFKRIDATIKVDDKSQNVYENYVELTEEEIKELTREILNTLANDSEFSKVFKKLFNSDADVTSLTQTLDKATLPGTYRLSFYTNKDLLNQKLVSIRLENKYDNVTTSINFDKPNNEEMIISVNSRDGLISCYIKKTKSIFNMDLSIDIKDAKVTLNLSSNYEAIKEITKPDISNSKKIEDLTLEERQKINEKIQANKGMTSFTQDVAKLYPAP